MKVVFHFSSGPILSAELDSLSEQGLFVTQIPVDDKVGFEQAMREV